MALHVPMSAPHDPNRAETRLELVRRLVHNARSQLGAVLGYAEIIQRLAPHSAWPQAEDYARPILQQTLAVGQTLDQLVLVTRLDEALLDVQLAPILFGPLLAEVSAEVNQFYQREIMVLDTLTPQTAYGDVVHLRTALANVLDNALKFSAPSTQVQVVGGRAPQPGWAEIQVLDHGWGIAPADQAKLFTRFGRIYTEQTHHLPGNGLGLYLAKGLMEAQQGQIYLTSEREHGTTCTLRLPLLPSEG